MNSLFTQSLPQAIHLNWRQAIGEVGVIARPHHLRQVHDGVTRHGESNSRLLVTKSFDSGNHQRAGIEDSRQRPQPGLIIVLRAEKTQRRIGKMAFQYLSSPAFPVAKNPVQHLLLRQVAEAAEQFRGRG